VILCIDDVRKNEVFGFFGVNFNGQFLQEAYQASCTPPALSVEQML